MFSLMQPIAKNVALKIRVWHNEKKSKGAKKQ